MKRYVAFLRGMNLGRRRIKNGELCACFADMGFSSVAAFLASGNVIFDAALDDPAGVSARIESGLRQALHYDVPTFLRSADEVRAITRYQPFTAAQLKRSKGKPQVALLSKHPTPIERAVLELSTAEDRLDIHGWELFWLPSGGMREAELDLKRIAAELGPMTIRTRNTLERLVAKYLN